MLAVQQNMETEYLARANYLTGQRVVLFDRGVLDDAAFFHGGLLAFIKAFNLDLKQVYDRYDAVLHLQSVAVNAPEREIEAKYILERLPSLVGQGEEILQGYVGSMPQLRLRQIDGDRCYLTVKSTGMGARD